MSNEQNREGEDAKKMNRRSFMMRVSLGFAGLSAVIAAFPVVSALLAPLFEKKTPVWRKLGKLSEFAPGITKLVSFENADPTNYAGVTARSAAWIQHNKDGELIAFASNCTHLGCPVRWEEGAQLFMCPCHGGVYYKNGTVAAGPPPKPLTRYELRVIKGELQLRTKPLPITGLKA